MARKTQVATYVAPVRRANNVDVAVGVPNVHLDISITTGDLVDIRVGEVTEMLSVERDNCERQLDAAMKLRDKSVKHLEELASKMIEAHSIDQSVRELRDRLEEFTDNKYNIKVVAVGASDYSSYYGVKKSDVDDEPEVNIKKSKIIGEVRIIENGVSKSVLVRKKIEIAFSLDMLTAVTEIEAKSNAVREVEDKLLDVRKRIADIPQLRTRAKNELTKAYLRGQLTSGSQMLDTVMKTPVKSLPEIVQG